MKTRIPLSKKLSNYKPVPGERFYKRMESAPWQETRNVRLSMKEKTNFHNGWKYAIAVLMTIVVLSLGIPSVRASLSAWLGLSVAPSNEMPAQSVDLIEVTPSVDATSVGEGVHSSITPNESLLNLSPEIASQIKQISSMTGWEILIPNTLPENYTVESVYFDQNNQMAVLTLTSTRTLEDATQPGLTSTSTITLLEAQKNDFVPMQVSPDASISDVQVNGQPAVFVLGAWDTQFVPDEKDPAGGQMVSTWSNDLPVKNLYWQVGNTFLLLVTQDTQIDQQALITIAENFGK